MSVRALHTPYSLLTAALLFLLPLAPCSPHPDRNVGPFNNPGLRVGLASTSPRPTSIQLSVNWTSSDEAVVDHGSTLYGLLDLYNPHRLAALWNRTKDSNSTCYKDMTNYLIELTHGQLWALQMADASGRYNGGFFWGNNYWMGSLTHCKHINPPPPFPSGFYVFKAHVKLNDTLTPNFHNYLVGVCLPESCNPLEAEDIVRLSVETASQSHQRTVLVTPIKTPHTQYYLTEDSTFWILFSVTSVVIVLVIAGTSLELYEDYASEKRKRAKFVYDNYTYEVAKTQHHQEVITGAVKLPIGANNNENSETESSERNSVTSDEVTSIFNGIWKDVLLSFSLKKNVATICERSVGDDTIPTIHGLRSISMAWVVLGHTCISAFRYSDNMAFRAIADQKFAFQFINNGAYSVDTFFFISGLLVAFLYFRTTAKHDMTKLTRSTGFTSSVLEFLGMIAYRFARLTAPYFFVLGVVQVTMRWFHHNSVFETPTDDYINCANYWWRNLLYINTLFPVEDMCMLWSWYLADDTQFYVLGAILLIMAVKHFKAAFSLMMVFLVSSWCTTALIAYQNNHIPNEDDPFALFDKIYDKPWTRLGPYLVGMAVGYILFKTDCKINMRRRTVVVGWTASSGILLFLVYGLYGSKLSPIMAAAFSSLSHTAWAFGLAWIVIACSTGHGGYVTKILSSSILYPFSRVTYCAYLIHPVVIRTFTMLQEAPVHLGFQMVALTFTGHLVMSYLIAFIISILFEAPIVSLLRIISPTKRRKSKS